MIDLLKIKLNPLVLNKGIRLFGDSMKQCRPNALDIQKFDDNELYIMTCRIDYGA